MVGDGAARESGEGGEGERRGLRRGDRGLGEGGDGAVGWGRGLGGDNGATGLRGRLQGGGARWEVRRGGRRGNRAARAATGRDRGWGGRRWGGGAGLQRWRRSGEGTWAAAEWGMKYKWHSRD